MEPYRALISDRLRKAQIARGFLTQSLFTGAGAVLANVSLYVMQQFISGATASGVPYWVFVCFWLGAVCCLVTISIAMMRTREVEPTAEELAHIRSQSKGLPATVKEIADAVRVMPIGMHKIGLAFLFQWYAMFIYWQFVSVSVAETVFNAAPETPGYEEAAAWTGLMNGSYNFVTMLSALFLLPLCQRFGGKRVHAGTLLLAGLSLAWLSQISVQWMTLLPMIGLGICWASMVGVPYLMVASMVPRERTGVYMGILNMMIVVPMLIQTLTFGWIYENLLGDSGANAILVAGVLLGCAALAMLWVNAPESEDEESPIMPLGAPRSIRVYDQVIVGSDGSPASLHTVGHAAGVANAADARLVVVSAYRDDDTASPAGASVDGAGGAGGAGVAVRRELHGRDAAMAAVRASLKELTTDRVRTIDSRVVAGDPASALLEVAGGNPRNLIVVGNRGVGAREGELLGAVPAAVVRNAVCNVLIIQTSDDPPREGNIGSD